jgi:hypothetical protein
MTDYTVTYRSTDAGLQTFEVWNVSSPSDALAQFALHNLINTGRDGLQSVVSCETGAPPDGLRSIVSHEPDTYIDHENL